jgi:hypothetical protein
MLFPNMGKKWRIGGKSCKFRHSSPLTPLALGSNTISVLNLTTIRSPILIPTRDPVTSRLNPAHNSPVTILTSPPTDIMPYTFATTPFNANSLSFSPYNDSLLAVTSSQNFGLVGNGRIHILQLSPAGIKPLNSYVPKPPPVPQPFSRKSKLM